MNRTPQDLWRLQYTGANWMSCVGCVGANYTKLAQNQQLKNDTRACISVLRLVRSCCQHFILQQPRIAIRSTHQCFATSATSSMSQQAAIHKKPYKCGLKPYDWYSHTIHSCKVCTGECNCTKGNPLTHMGMQ